VSCTLHVRGMQRTIYALPDVKDAAQMSKEEQTKKLMEIYSEFEELRKKRFPTITAWKCKMVERKYAFELPLPHGEHKFLKIKYDATMPPLPSNLSGRSFKCVFGTT